MQIYLAKYQKILLIVILLISLPIYGTKSEQKTIIEKRKEEPLRYILHTLQHKITASLRSIARGPVVLRTLVQQNSEFTLKYDVSPTQCHCQVHAGSPVLPENPGALLIYEDIFRFRVLTSSTEEDYWIRYVIETEVSTNYYHVDQQSNDVVLILPTILSTSTPGIRVDYSAHFPPQGTVQLQLETPGSESSIPKLQFIVRSPPTIINLSPLPAVDILQMSLDISFDDAHHYSMTIRIPPQTAALHVFAPEYIHISDTLFADYTFQQISNEVMFFGPEKANEEEYGEYTSIGTLDLHSFGGQTIVMTGCRIYGESIHWPTTSIHYLSFDTVVFQEPVDLSGIPAVTTLEFDWVQTQQQQPVVRKLPPVVTVLTFSEGALGIIHTLASDSFAVTTVSTIRLHEAAFTALRRYEQHELTTRLCELITLRTFDVESNCFYRLYKQLYGSSRKIVVTSTDNRFIVIDVDKLREAEHRMPEPVLSVTTEYHHPEQSWYQDRILWSQSIIWPNTAIDFLAFRRVTFSSPFNLGMIPRINILMFEAIDYPRPEVIDESQFPPEITQIHFRRRTLSLINRIQPKNFARTVGEMYIHEDEFWRVLESLGRTQLVENICRLITRKNPREFGHCLANVKQRVFFHPTMRIFGNEPFILIDVEQCLKF